MLGIDKGQKREVEAFIEAVKAGGPMPISLSSQIATTGCTFAAIRSAASRRVESIQGWSIGANMSMDTSEVDTGR